MLVKFEKFSRHQNRRMAPPGAPPSTVGGSTVYGYQPNAMRGKIARDYLTETICKSQVKRMKQFKGYCLLILIFPLDDLACLISRETAKNRNFLLENFESYCFGVVFLKF